MGKIAEKVEQIKITENLTTSELFTKYPHLADMLLDEQKEEAELKAENRLKESQKQLLKG